MSQTTTNAELATAIEAIDAIYQQQIKLLLYTIAELKQERPTRIKLLVNGSARWVREADITEVRIVDGMTGGAYLRVNLANHAGSWFALPLNSPQALTLMGWLDSDALDLSTK